MLCILLTLTTSSVRGFLNVSLGAVLPKPKALTIGVQSVNGSNASMECNGSNANMECAEGKNCAVLPKPKVQSVNRSNANMECGAEGKNCVVLPKPKVQSVNGSNANMECGAEGKNCLFDGRTPHINTSRLDWASELVTIRESQPSYVISFDHVLLTFIFETCVKPTSIEIHLFLCSEWGIGAPYIGLFGSYSPMLMHHDIDISGGDFIFNYNPTSGTCGCLSKIYIPIQGAEEPYPIWHLLFTMHDPSIEWVYLGEVIFLNTSVSGDEGPVTSTDCDFEPPPGMYALYILIHSLYCWLSWGKPLNYV